MWTVQAWYKETKSWQFVASTGADGAKSALKLIAVKGRVGRATHPNGQQMWHWPARGLRPLTFYHYRPLEKDEKDDEIQTPE